MLVRESISFERYKDPKAALGVGGEAQVKNAIDHIFREDNEDPYYHTIFGIDISPKSKTFTIQFYSDEFRNNAGKKLNKKNRAIELVKNAGIEEYFYDVNYNYKVRWWIVFKIKPEYQKFFKPIWIDGIDYRKSLKESVSFERYRDPKKALGFNDLDVNFPEESVNRAYNYIKSKYTIHEPKWFTDLVGNKHYYFSFSIGKNHYTISHNSFSNEIRITETRNNPMNLKQLSDIDKYIEENIQESISFERYKDPKTALGLTTLDSIRQWMIDVGHNVHPNNPEKHELERYLAYAVNDNKTEYAQYLLHIGVDPNRAPLGIAIRDDNFEMVKMLLDAGANFEFSKDTNASKEMKDFVKNYKNKNSNDKHS